MVRIALAQLDQVVGDIAGNVARLVRAVRWAEGAGAQVLAAPELAITGYPPEDLVLKSSFVAANQRALEDFAAEVGGMVAIVGFVDCEGDSLFNAAAICQGGSVVDVYRKQLLPNYGVFDERRYFTPGATDLLIEAGEANLGVCVCEDVWSETGPAVSVGDAGAQVVININASPFHKAKLSERAAMLGDRARRAQATIVYVNMVGGQDELVFDGGSMVVAPDGQLLQSLPQFQEVLAVADVPLGLARDVLGPSLERIQLELPAAREDRPRPADEARALKGAEEIYGALELSLRDYVTKNGFEGVVIGLSGGIDSALTATIATDALGADNVLTLAMPSDYSTSHSLEDARALAHNLGVELDEIPIAELYRSFGKVLEEALGPSEEGLAEENLQARLRGNLLMFVSNRYGHLVVATGNKSEMACGYATLYGDMAGGFALLKDVFKTEVYELARWRNSLGAVIPENILTKAPSAELRPDQKDTDSLPPYDVLDPILEAYIERDEGITDIVATGADEDVVTRVIAMVDRAEYKRRQAPPGPKVTIRAFGRDRRLPITNKWREGGRVEVPAKVVGEHGDR